MTLDDIKQIQAKASERNNSDERPKGNLFKEKQKKSGLVVKAQDTALAKALAAAMSGATVNMNEEASKDDKASLTNKVIQEYNDSLLSRKIGDKTKLSKSLVLAKSL